MKIQKILISDLFDSFNYEINLNRQEEITIITGPNGFGKTMILNIIYSLFNRRFFFFNKLVFSKIEVILDEGYRIEIKKENDQKKIIPNTEESEASNELKREEKKNIELIFFKHNKQFHSFSYSTKQEGDLTRYIERTTRLRRISDEQWIDRQSDRIMNIEDILFEHYSVFPNRIINEIGGHNLKNEEADRILNSINVYLIKEQRLLRQSNYDSRYYPEGPKSFLTYTIQEYAEDLNQLIKQTIAEFFQISQGLDNSFPKRLLEETGVLSEDDFDKRFKILKGKQERLKRFGLSTSFQEVPKYDSKDAKVLLVYLNDSVKKNEVFDDLLDRIELFTGILNERRFAYKTIRIDKQKGFVFYTDKEKVLNPIDLSSGEQHEVVLLYDLIFKAKSNTVVLIDEPEISLHVSWQTEFLRDLARIVKLQNIHIIIATHSPQIINDNWHLTIDLNKQVSL